VINLFAANDIPCFDETIRCRHLWWPTEHLDGHLRRATPVAIIDCRQIADGENGACDQKKLRELYKALIVKECA